MLEARSPAAFGFGMRRRLFLLPDGTPATTSYVLLYKENIDIGDTDTDSDASPTTAERTPYTTRDTST